MGGGLCLNFTTHSPRVTVLHTAPVARGTRFLLQDGFLSWNTLGATLQANVAAGVDPFEL